MTSIGVLAGWRHHALTLALALMLKYLGLFYFLQAFSSFGPLVRMISQIMYDMRHFMVILWIAVLASGSALYSLLHIPDSIPDKDNPFNGPGSTLFFLFNMLLLGNYDLQDFVYGEYQVLVQILFVEMEITTLIILLNLMIALMSDSYERIKVPLLPSSLLVVPHLTPRRTNPRSNFSCFVPES